MFDSGSGSGQCFDWKQYQQLAPAGRSCFLAGGINRDNIAAALALAPYAIDISSGAESGGLKDRDKILELVRLMGVA